MDISLWVIRSRVSVCMWGSTVRKDRSNIEDPKLVTWALMTRGSSLPSFRPAFICWGLSWGNKWRHDSPLIWASLQSIRPLKISILEVWTNTNFYSSKKINTYNLRCNHFSNNPTANLQGDKNVMQSSKAIVETLVLSLGFLERLVFNANLTQKHAFGWGGGVQSNFIWYTMTGLSLDLLSLGNHLANRSKLIPSLHYRLDVQLNGLKFTQETPMRSKQ